MGAVNNLLGECMHNSTLISTGSRKQLLNMEQLQVSSERRSTPNKQKRVFPFQRKFLTSHAQQWGQHTGLGMGGAQGRLLPSCDPSFHSNLPQDAPRCSNHLHKGVGDHLNTQLAGRGHSLKGPVDAGER